MEDCSTVLQYSLTSRVKTETKRYGSPASAASVQVPNYYPAQPASFSSNLLPAEVVNSIYQQQQLQQLRQPQQFQQLNPLQQFQQMNPLQQFQQLNQQQQQFLQPYVPATFNPNPYVSIPDISNSILSYQRPMADEYPAMNSDEQSQVPPKQNQPTNPVVSFISGIPTILNGPNGPGANLVQNIVRPFTNAFENFQNNLPTLQNNPITNLLQNTQNGIQNLIPSENPLNGVLGNIQNSAAQVLPQGSGNPFQNLFQSGQNLFQNSQNVVQSALQDNPVTNFLNNPSENLQQLLPQGGPLNNFLSNNGFTQNSAFPNIFQNPIFPRPQAAPIVAPTQSNLNRYQMLQMNQNRNGTRTTTKRKKTKPSRDPDWLNEFLDDRKRQMADLKGPERGVVGETTTMRTTVAEPTTPAAEVSHA